MTKFVSFYGLNEPGQKVTTNLNYLIRFQPINEGIDIWVYDGQNAIKYSVDISYDAMCRLIQEPI